MNGVNSYRCVMARTRWSDGRNRYGDDVTLDFVNTVDWRLSPERSEDWFDSYSDMVEWAVWIGWLTASVGRALKKKGLEDRRASARSLARVKRLRESLFRAFKALSESKTPKASDIDQINRNLAAAMSRMNLRTADTAVELNWTIQPDDLLPFVPELTWKAAQLLASDQTARIRMCAAEDCGWLFLDKSRNRKRRWCTMKTCGNRAKARAYYRRQSTT
ncbi:MAG: CGNR zinc finger domain-containing protein [Pseudomonadota bacterium]